MRSFAIIMLGLMVAATGCRVGMYGGSLHGRGQVTRPAAQPPSSPETTASASDSVYDVGSDYVRGRFALLTVIGGGTLHLRSRNATMIGEIEDYDLHVGIGAGYVLWQRSTVQLGAYGLLTQNLVTNDVVGLSRRLAVGLEVNVLSPFKDPGEGIGAAVRFAYVRGWGSLAGNFDEENPRLDIGALMLQLGVVIRVRGND